MNRIVLLLLLVGSINTAVAQRATKVEKIGEDKWVATIPIAPKGQNGPYIPNFKVTIDLITVNSGDDSGADAVGVGLRFATGGVVKYRYQGVDYVDDASMKLEVGVCTGFYEFNYRITVANAGSISSYSKDFAKIPIGKKLVYKEVETLKKKLAITSFEITDYELVQSDLDYIGRRVDAKKKSVEQQIESNQTSDSSTSQTSTQRNTQSESSQNTNATNNVDIVQVAQAHNAAEIAKSDALTNASNQTFDQWAQGNYIQGAKPLVDEFARQGNATGAYGTMGVAVAAQTGAIIGDAIAARRARKAEEAAYNYELDKGIEAYYARNYTEALKWYQSSFEQGKNTGAAANGLGCAYFRVKNYPEAKKWLDIAISLNYTSRNTNFCLSRMYLDGLGVSKNEHKAFQLMENAAGNLGFDFPEATYHLAFLYLSGRGVTQNYKKAYDLFLSIPSGGPGTPGHNYNKEVDFALGVMYYYGLGLKKNDDMAKKYFEKCSDNYDAQEMLSKISGTVSLYHLSEPNNETTHETFGKFLNL